MLRNPEIALRERVKELTCLYGIARVAAQPGLALDAMLGRIVPLLPPAWLYPESAAARIVLDGRAYESAPGAEFAQSMVSGISVNGTPRGTVEVGYLDKRPPLDEGPFLQEERFLIDAVAREVGLLVDRERLQAQLLHADRLATIGELAAGVAHELNEPLGQILGFAQLARKAPGLPDPTARDLDKIVARSLHAREVVRKLLVFARQEAPSLTMVQLNRIAQDALPFFETRFQQAGVRLVLDLAPGLPELLADAVQLNQALVNLVVNALQSMPAGGTLTVRTRAGEGEVCLEVEDTGTGMTPEILEKVFLPFFTTKDVGRGTGLGLPVVHGIVTAHGGSIRVESRPGHGSRFELRLPLRGAAP